MRRAAFALVLVLAAWATPAIAHEIGSTRAAAVFDADGTYRIDLVADPDALLTKLEVFGNSPVSTSTDRAARDRHIAERLPVLLTRVVVRFDATADRPSAEYVPGTAAADAAGPPSAVRLTGHIPRGAHTATFTDGLAMGSYAFTVRIADGPMQTFWLAGGEESAPVSLRAKPSVLATAAVVRQYFVLGFTHILPGGLDHILFVIGIFLLNTRWRSILSQVSAFTLAHSITLGLTMYGLVSLSPRIVEPAIALSIAYLAIENLFTTELKQRRVALVFGFGLLHGMGFAGVLKELGLPRADFLTGLVTFNLGVEAGQLAVIAIAFGAVAYWRSNRVAYRRFIVQPASCAIALAGLYWTIQRAFGI